MGTLRGNLSKEKGVSQRMLEVLPCLQTMSRVLRPSAPTHNIGHSSTLSAWDQLLGPYTFRRTEEKFSQLYFFRAESYRGGRFKFHGN